MKRISLFSDMKKILAYLSYLISISLLPCICFGSITPVKNSNLAPLAKEILDQFSNYAEKIRKEWHVPGMAIALVQDGKIIYAQGFGKRNAEGAPVTPTTIFDIASLTKSFTATLLAMQIDEGKYTWGTKVLKLYPAFKLYDEKTTKGFEVQDLLAHDSGLPESATSHLEDFGYSIDHILYILRFIKPVAPFRTEVSYQNIFPMLAGEIIQKLSGKSYTDNLRQNLFDPLQMDNSYNDTEEKLYHHKNLAQPFFYSSGHLHAYPMNSSYQSKRRASENSAGGSGGIYSSAVDLAKWLIFNMNNGSVGKTQLVSLKNMAFIHTPQNLITPSTLKRNSKEKIEPTYGQGWVIDRSKYSPYTMLYHPGGGMGMHALMAYIPEKKIGIVILTNTWGNKVPEALYQRFFDLCLRKKILKDWSALYLQEQALHSSMNTAPQSNRSPPIRELDLKKYTGTYYNPVFGRLKVSKRKDHLLLHIGPMGIIWHLAYYQKNVFQAYWPNPYGMKFPMLPMNQNSVEFIEERNKGIQKMIVPFFNSNGNGIFERLNENIIDPTYSKK